MQLEDFVARAFGPTCTLYILQKKLLFQILAMAKRVFVSDNYLPTDLGTKSAKYLGK